MARSPPVRVLRLNFVQHRKDCVLRLLFQAVGHLRPAQRVRFAVRHRGGLHQLAQGLVHHLLCGSSDSAAARQQRALQHQLVAERRLILLQIFQTQPRVAVQVRVRLVRQGKARNQVAFAVLRVRHK